MIRRRGLLAVAGDERAGLRVLIQEPDLGADEVAEIAELASRAGGPVDAEDPFSATDLSRLGMRSWQMPVMLRQPGPVAEPAMDVTRVRNEEDLRAAERAVIAGFELTRFEPYRGGEVFPMALIEQPGVDVFVARLDGAVAGACVTVGLDLVVLAIVLGHSGTRARGAARRGERLDEPTREHRRATDQREPAAAAAPRHAALIHRLHIAPSQCRRSMLEIGEFAGDLSGQCRLHRLGVDVVWGENTWKIGTVDCGPCGGARREPSSPRRRHPPESPHSPWDSR